jgi:hypothetical protein
VAAAARPPRPGAPRRPPLAAAAAGRLARAPPHHPAAQLQVGALEPYTAVNMRSARSGPPSLRVVLWLCFALLLTLTSDLLFPASF